MRREVAVRRLDVTQDAEIRRLRWHCRRGMKELDIVLNRYLDRDYALASEQERLAFQALLDQEDPVIWTWVLGAESPPEGLLADVIHKLSIAR